MVVVGVFGGAVVVLGECAASDAGVTGVAWVTTAAFTASASIGVGTRLAAYPMCDPAMVTEMDVSVGRCTVAAIVCCGAVVDPVDPAKMAARLLGSTRVSVVLPCVRRAIAGNGALVYVAPAVGSGLCGASSSGGAYGGASVDGTAAADVTSLVSESGLGGGSTVTGTISALAAS